MYLLECSQSFDIESETTVEINGIEFPPAFNAPGARGLLGEGYWYDSIARIFGKSWKGTAFVAKTTTLNYQEGNMPMGKNGITPTEKLPKCIKFWVRNGHVLNAVKLSGPGLRSLLGRNAWQARTEPFMISFMAVAATPDERLEELREFCRILQPALKRFNAPVVVQLNFACPSAGDKMLERLKELPDMLDVVLSFGMQVVLNLNALAPVRAMHIAQRHSACIALWIANSIPWGEAPDVINWEKFNAPGQLPGNLVSPLRTRGFKEEGGLSGPDCLVLTERAIKDARAHGITMLIIAGNGVQRKRDVDLLVDAGADGIAIGVVAMLRFWRMLGIIKRIHQRLD